MKKKVTIKIIEGYLEDRFGKETLKLRSIIISDGYGPYPYKYCLFLVRWWIEDYNTVCIKVTPCSDSDYLDKIIETILSDLIAIGKWDNNIKLKLIRDEKRDISLYSF